MKDALENVKQVIEGEENESTVKEPTESVEIDERIIHEGQAAEGPSTEPCCS